MRKSAVGTTSGPSADRPTPVPRHTDPSGDIHDNGHDALPQPVAVDGCGGPVPLAAKSNGDPWAVTTTAEWTDKPLNPSGAPCPPPEELSPEKSRDGTNDGGQLIKQIAKGMRKEEVTTADQVTLGAKVKQYGDCPQNDKEQPPNGKPWVGALSACQILAPIPEGDGNFANDDTVAISNEGKKPKALPLCASHPWNVTETSLCRSERICAWGLLSPLTLHLPRLCRG